MPLASQPLGRRERNKQAKLERIVAAASELLAERSIDDVTTQEIADKADIGTGTLFLYARTKGELLLLVQNARYADALERGRTAAASAATALDAVTALVTPIVECNRIQIDNGRTYLREMAFGDSTEPHNVEALSILGQTQQTVVDLVARHAGLGTTEAKTLAQVVYAIVFMTMASSVDPDTSVADVVGSIRTQVEAILPR